MPVLCWKRGEFEREVAPTFSSRPHRYDDPPLTRPPRDPSGFCEVERFFRQIGERLPVLGDASPQTVRANSSGPAVLVERLEVATDQSVYEIRDQRTKSVRNNHTPRLPSDLTLGWASVLSPEQAT
jgi:hypothetical protein